MRIFLVLSLLLTLAVSAAATPLTGRVVLGDEPLVGMRVGVWPSLDFSGSPLKSSLSNDEGEYRFELPPGRYALFARDEKGSLFAFCGRNPVVVAEMPLWAGLQAVPVAQEERLLYDDEYAAALEGRVVDESGQPLADAYVYLYLDSRDDLKGQGYRLSLPTDAEGFFSFDGLPESSYHLVVRKRAAGGRVGPVLEGDWLGIYPGNPLALTAGSTLRLTLPAVQRLQQDDERFVAAAAPHGAQVEGRIVDLAGNPLAGLYVFAYTERVIGHRRPAAISSPTGSDGRYTLLLPKAGTYYLGARQLYGDSPAPGELFGQYDESHDHGLTLASDEKRKGIIIRVEPIRF